MWECPLSAWEFPLRLRECPFRIWECPFRVLECSFKCGSTLLGILKKKSFSVEIMWPKLFKSHNVLYIMFVLSLNFGQKAVLVNLLYFNLMKYNNLYMVTKVQLINKRIIQSKRKIKKPKNTFLNRNLCVLILDFDHEESFTNISHYDRIKHQN